MKPYHTSKGFFTYFYSSSTTNASTVTTIPITSSNDSSPSAALQVPTTTEQTRSCAAIKIQSAYRSHTVRLLLKKIRSIDSSATRIERLIQCQDTVDAIRRDERERVRMNEALMELLLRLDSVPGVTPAVRDQRRGVSRRIVALQEIVDFISDAKVGEWDLFLSEWEEAVEEIEKDACREVGGGEELERFCAEKLGFRCLQRFLRQP